MQRSSSTRDEPSHGGWFTVAARRVLITVAGVLVIAGGVAMLFLPGPGILAIVGGLALLGTEYTWAKRSAAWFRRRFTDAVEHLHHDQHADPATEDYGAADAADGTDGTSGDAGEVVEEEAEAEG